MEYIVERTSNFEDNKPCEEAYEVEVLSYDYRSCKTIEEAKKHHWFDSWFNNTIDHVELPNCIRGTRKAKEKCWAIQINSLEELNSFYEKYGKIIITNPWFNRDIKVIEIYDYYRE